MRELERLNELFDADFESGILTWKKVTTNRVKVGDVPSSVSNCGYYTVKVDGKRLLVHRVLWFMKNGEVPDFLDHINGDKLDNRLSNLRPATKTQNNANRPAKANCTSSYKGVYWAKHRGKWHTQIQHKGKKVNLGLFLCELEAARAYDKAAVDYHGEFAKLNFPIAYEEKRS